jgi:Glycosyl hydrolases family 25
MMPGFDLAFNQLIPLPPTEWEFGFVQATHDSGGYDVGFPWHWQALLIPRIKVRGAYHFAYPDSTDGLHQGMLFVARVKANGWKANSDIWGLDVEGNVALRGPALAAWITEFMDYVTSQLGDRGFLYIGWPFFVTHISATDFSLLQRYRWWLPDYGINDGFEHPLGAGEPIVPVIHQYTSKPRDTNVILDYTKWNLLFGPATPPPPPVTVTYNEDTMQQDDFTRTLDGAGNGYFDVPNVTDAGAHFAWIIGLPDPEKHGYPKVPNTYLTLGETSKVDRVVIVGGTPNSSVTVRVNHS